MKRREGRKKLDVILHRIGIPGAIQLIEHKHTREVEEQNYIGPMPF